MKILLTGCAGPAGRALGRQFINLDHSIVGVDMAPSPNPAFAATETVPAASDPGMLERLKEIIRDHEIDLILPTVSDELPAVAAAADELARLAPVVIGPAPAVSAAHDKYLTARALASADVPVPRFALPSEFAGLDEALEAFGGILIVKPRVSRGGRGVTVVESPADIDFARVDDSSIIQEFIPGDEYAPMVFAPRRPEADPFAVALKKTELKEGRVGNAVSVVRVDSDETGEAQRVRDAAIRAIIGIGLTGPADVDVRMRADGTPAVLEINARFGANSDHAPEILAAALEDYSPNPAVGG